MEEVSCGRAEDVYKRQVFTQFENDGNNNYTPLEHPNIDTGMGLERLACIMQGVDNLFLVDTVQNIMKHISRIAGVQYGEGEKSDISLRVITDHIRSTTFMIGDGVLPSNEGRGYVLRRLLRRAARHGRLLGINKPFLAEVCDTVIEENKNAYPELVEKRDYIKKLVSVEEESFAKTIDQGMQMLNTLMDTADLDVISGEDAFRLNDTYGFPLDLTKEILAERGMKVDEEEFSRLLKEQRDRARAVSYTHLDVYKRQIFILWILTRQYFILIKRIRFQRDLSAPTARMTTRGSHLAPSVTRVWMQSMQC